MSTQMTKRPEWGVEDNNPAGESPREKARGMRSRSRVIAMPDSRTVHLWAIAPWIAAASSANELIRGIDDRVLRTACTQRKRWQAGTRRGNKHQDSFVERRT